MLTRGVIRSAAVFLGAVLALSGCSALFPTENNPIPPGVHAPSAAPDGPHVFSLVDHYVGVHELGDAAIALACMPPEKSWTQEEVDGRWRMAELMDASEYPSKFLATQYYLEDAEHYATFLVGVTRSADSTQAALSFCDNETERWTGEIARQEAACVADAATAGTCWSRDLAGEAVSPPAAALDLATYQRGPVAVTADYIGVHELAEAAVGVACAAPGPTWTAAEAQRYRDVAALFQASEYPSGLYSAQGYLDTAEHYEKYLIDVPRTAESVAAAQKACDSETARWAAEVERQEKACASATTVASTCWSRDLAEK